MDPIADSVRAILDGHIVLDRDLASRGHFPCIDVLASNSRLMRQTVDPEHQESATEIRDLLGTYKKAEDLIQIGAYKKGSNARIDTAVDRLDAINAFLKQHSEERSEMVVTREQLIELAALPSAQSRASHG